MKKKAIFERCPCTTEIDTYGEIHKHHEEWCKYGQDGWVSVSPTTMPEYDVDVQLWGDGWKHVYVGYWRHSHEWIGRHRPEDTDALPDTDPIYWRPLAAPPEASIPSRPGEPKRKFRDGEPCGHPGCLRHLSHPCEGCGRIGGKYPGPEGGKHE